MCFTDKRKRNWIRKEDCLPDLVRPPGWVRYEGAGRHRRHIESLLIVIIRGLLPTHPAVIALYFKGISMMLYHIPCTILDGTNSY